MTQPDPRSALRARRLLLGLALWLAGAAGCASAPTAEADARNASAGTAAPVTLESEGLGVRWRLEGWRVFREAAGAPPLLQPLLARKQHVDDSPVIVALPSSDPTVTLLHMATPYQGDRDGLVRVLPPTAEIHEAKPLPGGRGLRVAYTIRSGIMTVRSRAVLFEQWGLAHQLIVSGVVESDRLAHLAAAARGLELRTDEGWERPFADFPRELTTANLTGVVSEEGAFDAFDAVRCEPGERQLLYRIEGGDAIVHLFGSIHFGRASFFPFDTTIETAFARSTRLGVEMDARAAASPEAQRSFARAASLDQHENLRAALSDDAYARLEAALVGLGVPIAVFDQLEPWAVAMTVSTLVWQAQGFDPAQGVDLYFLERSGAKEVVELESLEEQLDLFASLEGDEFLGMTLDSLEYVEQDTLDIYRAWLCGDAESVTRLFVDLPVERGQDIGDFIVRFLDERNQGMAEGVVELLERGGESFVVVGVGHLVGPNGVPALLRERGLTVESR
jgi:uncharacterized protein YbaP (TraB family)